VKLDLRIAAGLGAVALAGYALFILVRPPDAVEEVASAWGGDDGEAEDGPTDERADAEAERRRLAAAARGGPAEDSDLPVDELEVPPPALVDAPGAEVTPASARAGFDYSMRRVEKIAARKRRLKPEQWEALYREANDAYAALAIVLDGKDETQMRELEDAHRRLRDGLAAVRVRGKKFGP
jgi:hypothetical protein